MIDLLSERVGGRVVECNDEFFAPAANMIKASEPVANDEYTDRGKWMDGWETRRRRDPGHDWCILALGIAGRVRRVTVDTSHFTGNYPEHFSLEGASDGSRPPHWVELIPKTGMRGDTVASFEVSDPHRIELVRLNIFPDGGVARLRVEGEPIPSLQLVCPEGVTDLAGAAVGGRVVDVSDRHYSDPANCLRPTSSEGMWDGWETRRRRGPGHDWLVVRLGLRGEVEGLVVDTTHFKGNAPGWVSFDVSDDGADWRRILDRVPVRADAVNQVALEEPVSAGFGRLSIHPDGGIARLRVLGTADPVAASETRIDYVNSLLDQPAEGFFATACSAGPWVEKMKAARPYRSVEEIFDHAERSFAELTESDWLTAFAAHPRIGEKGDPMSNREQTGVVGAGQATLRELVEVNRAYEQKFGFTYIVHATGKSADEMLEIARARLANSREEEIAIAAGEQRAITTTRLRRMLCQETT